MTTDKKQYWLDDPRNIKRIVRVLAVVCGLLVLADLFYDKHAHFAWENWFGFFGLFGFFMSFALVLAAREMRKVLMKDEDFYDR